MTNLEDEFRDRQRKRFGVELRGSVEILFFRHILA